MRSWRIANVPALDSLGHRLDDAFRPAALSGSADNLERDVIPLVDATEMASMFAMTWQRAHIDSPIFFLCNSGAYAALVSHHSFRRSIMATDHALKCVFEWLALWLESRGVEVDRERKLVHLSGYQALFYRAAQGI